MLFIKRAHSSSKLEEIYGDIVCNLNGIVFPLSSCMECKQDNYYKCIVCQATYTDELMGKMFLCGHLIMHRGVMNFSST